MGGFFVTFLTRICFFFVLFNCTLDFGKNLMYVMCVCMWIGTIYWWCFVFTDLVYSQIIRDPQIRFRNQISLVFFDNEKYCSKNSWSTSFAALFLFFSISFLFVSFSFFLFLFFAYALSSRLDFFALYVYTLVFTTIWWFCQWFIYYAIVNVD